MDKIDFSKEITDHVIWNVRLRCFLDGGECITEEQAISHCDCTLGKWLYEKGIKRYGAISEFKKLEKRHAELHSIVRSIIQMKELGRISDAEEELIKLKSISLEIIFLITTVERRVRLDRNELQNNG